MASVASVSERPVAASPAMRMSLYVWSAPVITEACLEALGTGADVGTRLRRWLRGGRRRRVAARDRPRAIRRQGDALVAGRPVFGHGDRKRAADEFPSRENAIRISVPRSDSDVTRSPSVRLQISPSPRPPPP